MYIDSLQIPNLHSIVAVSNGFPLSIELLTKSRNLQGESLETLNFPEKFHDIGVKVHQKRFCGRMSYEDS